MPEQGAQLTVGDVATLIEEITGSAPEHLTSMSRLHDDLGLGGADFTWLILRLEERGDIDFPAELLEALLTVDDLIHYFNVKLEHR